MNLELLKSKIEQTNTSKIAIAEALKITRQGLYNKLSGEKEFKVSEINIISQMLSLTVAEREEIFFADYVGKSATKL